MGGTKQFRRHQVMRTVTVEPLSIPSDAAKLANLIRNGCNV